MFQYWFERHLSDSQIVDRVHAIANEYSESEIASRIQLLKQRAEKVALIFNEMHNSGKEHAASYKAEVNEDLERTTLELALLGKIITGDHF